MSDNTTFVTNQRLLIDRLSKIYNDVTNSYKFYWFLAILDVLKNTCKSELSFDELTQGMVAKVWRPLSQYQLSFGKLDSFIKIFDYVSEIHKERFISLPESFSDCLANLNSSQTLVLKELISRLLRWVPYRFLRPFLEEETTGLKDARVNTKIRALANGYMLQMPWKAPYSFSDNNIILNENWKQYLLDHDFILRSFTYFQLYRFVKKNNPEVANIHEKLFPPDAWTYGAG